MHLTMPFGSCCGYGTSPVFLRKVLGQERRTGLSLTSYILTTVVVFAVASYCEPEMGPTVTVMVGNFPYMAVWERRGGGYEEGWLEGGA